MKRIVEAKHSRFPLSGLAGSSVPWRGEDYSRKREGLPSTEFCESNPLRDVISLVAIRLLGEVSRRQLSRRATYCLQKGRSTDLHNRDVLLRGWNISRLTVECPGRWLCRLKG